MEVPLLYFRFHQYLRINLFPRALFDKHYKHITPHAKFLIDIFFQIDTNPKSNFEINLETQDFKIIETGKSQKFNISSYKKSNMSNGFDDIDYLINKKQEISKFANNSPY